MLVCEFAGWQPAAMRPDAMVDTTDIPDATLKATALLIAMGRPLAQRLVAKLPSRH